MNQNHKKYLKLLISVILSGIIIWLIYRKVDFVSLKEVLKKIQLLPTLFFLFLFIPQLYLASKRWNVMTRKIGGVDLNLFTSFKQVVGSYSANLIIPGKMGEIVRIPWMRKYNLKTPVLILVLLEKIFDLLSIFMILLVSLIIYLLSHDNNPPVLEIICYIIIAGFFCLGLFWIYRNRISAWIEKRFADYLENKSENFIYFRIKKTASLISHKMIWYFLISISLWVVQGLEFYAIFLMFDLSPSIVVVFTGSFLALLAGALPISIAGLGPRDAVIIEFFKGIAGYEILAGIGIISLFRIMIAGLIGLPFFMMQTKE